MPIIAMKPVFRIITLVVSAALASLAAAEEAEQVIDDTVNDVQNPLPAQATPAAQPAAERAVAPVQHWIEKHVQDTLLTEPSTYQRKPKNDRAGNRMRRAIEQARAQFAGTVLSANKYTSAQGEVYRIKIISEAGVIKTLEVVNPVAPQEVDAETAPR